MSIEQIIVISGIVGAFVLFAAVLAWGEHQTRAMARQSRVTTDGATKLQVER